MIGRPQITIVIPTVKGREDHLERCTRTYEERTPVRHEILVYRDLGPCGVAWQRGAEEADGNFIHFTADDLEPHPNWHIKAMNAVRLGRIPAPRIIRPNGGLESCGNWEQEMPEGSEVDLCRIPFCSREQWEDIGPMIPLHYYTDNWFTVMARRAGYTTTVCRSYQFTHHWAETGRGAGMSMNDRMVYDERLYSRYLEEGYEL